MGFNSVFKGLMSNLCTSVTTRNTTERKCIIRQTNKTTALQPDVFFTRLLVTNKGGSALPSAHTFQGQLQTPQSL